MLRRITEYSGLDAGKLMDIYSESNEENTEYFFPEETEEVLPETEELLPEEELLSGEMEETEELLPESMTALQFDAVDAGPCVVCGTRGWNYPTASNALSPEDGKIFRRELQRLEMALDRAEAIGGEKPILVMMHFPPRMAGDPETPFTRILEGRERVKAVVYGHLHGDAFAAGFSGESRGIRYYPVSCDGIGFRPREIPWP